MCMIVQYNVAFFRKAVNKSLWLGALHEPKANEGLFRRFSLSLSSEPVSTVTVYLLSFAIWRLVFVSWWSDEVPQSIIMVIFLTRGDRPSPQNVLFALHLFVSDVISTKQSVGKHRQFTGKCEKNKTKGDNDKRFTMPQWRLTDAGVWTLKTHHRQTRHASAEVQCGSTGRDR